jgi:hypothetical protein
MDLADRFQERHDIIGKVWDFFESVPFWRMTPRPELVDNGYCLAEAGRSRCLPLRSHGVQIGSPCRSIAGADGMPRHQPLGITE